MDIISTKMKPKDASFNYCVRSVTTIAEYDNEKEVFRGLFEKPANIIFKMMKAIMNITLIATNEQDKLINNETGEYSGCFGKLQKGEADFTSFAMVMPVTHLTNITQINISAVDSGVYILAPYSLSSSDDYEVPDLIQQLNVISIEVWSHIILACIIFGTLLLSVKRLYAQARKIGRFSRPDDDPLYGQSISYQVITHMLQTETCDYLRFKERFISIFMSIFAFVVITLFCSMMTTEQVSTKSYFVYDTYNRILSNKSVQPIWVEYMNDHFWYRDAPAGSARRQIWDQSIAIFKKYPNQPPLVQCDLNGMIEMGKLALKQRIVVFLSHTFQHLFLSGLCMSLPAFPGLSDLRFKVTKDMNLKPLLYAIPISKHSKAAPIMEWIVFRFIEHGLSSDPMIISVLEDFLVTTLPKKARLDDKYFECLEYKKFPTKDPKTLPLDLPNFRTLLYCYGAILLVALGVFFVERNTKPKKNIRRGKSVRLP